MKPLKQWMWLIKGERIAFYTRLAPVRFQPDTVHFDHRITRVVPYNAVWAVWGKPLLHSKRRKGAHDEEKKSAF
ncbi:hypothetical protein [Desmospora activa]|uniref:hypothetical protein n=1 Tax=Desmospora activa TaxID=500615 RepID=UPI000D30AF9A|nr:hypothetical protein [Desmospora activa]